MTRGAKFSNQIRVPGGTSLVAVLVLGGGGGYLVRGQIRQDLY